MKRKTVELSVHLAAVYATISLRINNYRKTNHYNTFAVIFHTKDNYFKLPNRMHTR